MNMLCLHDTDEFVVISVGDFCEEFSWDDYYKNDNLFAGKALPKEIVILNAYSGTQYQINVQIIQHKRFEILAKNAGIKVTYENL